MSPKKITYLHIYQLKFCKHFSSLLYACILSSLSYTVFIKDWNYYACYLLPKINTVITSCFISMTTITSAQIMLLLLERHYVNTRAFKIASVVIWNFWFILHTRYMICKYQAWSFLSPFYTLHILHSYLGHSHIHIYKYVLLSQQVWHKHYFIFISWHFQIIIFWIWPLANYTA